MTQPKNINIQEQNDIDKILELFKRNKRFFIISLCLTIIAAFLINRYTIPVYKIAASILIQEDKSNQSGSDINDYLNSNLFGRNINFQNELWVLKSTPVIEETVKNLDLMVNYFKKGRIQTYDAYGEVPFKISYLASHPQPINVRFTLTYLNQDSFRLSARAKNVSFYNFENERNIFSKSDWIFSQTCRIGELIETPDLSFIIDSLGNSGFKSNDELNDYEFEFKSIASLRNKIRRNLSFTIVEKASTVIEITMKSESTQKGIDVINELMRVYSERNLEQKNHIASITINYIEDQLAEISDSLILTEDKLQRFRSSNQLLNISDQATGIYSQYMDLRNQLEELNSRKRYYDYVSGLLKADNFSNMMLPASIGISDEVLNRLITDLINAQARRSALIENNQERNPLVQQLGFQIEGLKKTISENITAYANTNSISIDEMNKRIKKVEAEINRLPATQRQLGTIERKYRLNDAIYNYLMEKHAEAKITKASNMPNDFVIEPANRVGMNPVTPNKSRNYLVALILGLGFPAGLLLVKDALNNKISNSDDLEKLTDEPLLGKISHNRYKTTNVMFEFPKSTIAESFRALRTNLDFYVRGGHKKIIMVTSCFEGEGKSFIALNLAMSYAQLGRRTILIDFDLRKTKTYFAEKPESPEGLSSFMINKSEIQDIIIKSPHEKLDYIPSGILPPNPVELLALDKTEELFANLKNEYDIIVLDTTPLAQVTDAYLLVNHAEIKIIVTRQGSTLKSVFSLIMKDLHLKNIRNICIVLNDNRYQLDQYGYGYGYNNKKPLLASKSRRFISKS
jgi:tyrosine-protein kinase Etk/Wzc